MNTILASLVFGSSSSSSTGTPDFSCTAMTVIILSKDELYLLLVAMLTRDLVRS